MAAIRRAHQEFKNIEKLAPPWLSVEMVEPLKWNVILVPTYGIYSEYPIRFLVQLPSDYPFKPPKISLQDSIYHPLINEKTSLGGGDSWSPALMILHALKRILFLLEQPIELSHAVCSSTHNKQFKSDLKGFIKKILIYQEKPINDKIINDYLIWYKRMIEFHRRIDEKLKPVDPPKIITQPIVLEPPSPEHRISLFIKTISGQTHTVEICSESKISDLRQIIEIKNIFTTDAFRLIFAGKQLEDDQIIENCGLKNESTVYLVYRLRCCDGASIWRMETPKWEISLPYECQIAFLIGCSKAVPRLGKSSYVRVLYPDLCQLIFTYLSGAKEVSWNDYNGIKS